MVGVEGNLAEISPCSGPPWPGGAARDHPPPMATTGNPWSAVLVTHWFVLGLVIAALVAWQVPEVASSHGVLHLGAAKKPLVAFLFLCAGLLLPTRELVSALGQWKAHGVIQGFGFIVIPLIALVLDQLWRVLGVLPATREGILILACLPTTIASGVGFARMAGGNDALALCNATFGNLLGIVFTPLLLLVVIGRQVAAPAEDIIKELGLLVLAPLILGQIVRWLFPAVVAAGKKPLATANSLALLVLIWETLSDAVAGNHGAVSPGALGIAALLVLVFHSLLLVLAFALSGLPILGFSRPDRATITISATQKTVAMGVPLLAILYQGDPALPVLMLPLILYHSTQIFVASAFAPPMARWVAQAPR